MITCQVVVIGFFPILHCVIVAHAWQLGLLLWKDQPNLKPGISSWNRCFTAKSCFSTVKKLEKYGKKHQCLAVYSPCFLLVSFSFDGKIFRHISWPESQTETLKWVVKVHRIYSQYWNHVGLCRASILVINWWLLQSLLPKKITVPSITGSRSV